MLEKLNQAVSLAKKSKGDGDPEIWKMSDEDTEVYFFGTVHLLPEGVDWKSDKLSTIISDMNTLYIEADIESPEAQQAMMASIPKYGIFTDGSTLSSVLGDQAVVVQEAAEELGVPFAQVQPMKPWLVGLQMAQLQMTKEGLTPDAGVEAYLLAEAKKGSKIVAFLESGEDQIAALSGSDIENQVEGLVFQSKHMDKTTEVLDLLIDEWADGDVKGLEVLVANPDAMGDAGLYDRMLTVRNRNWVPKIEAILDVPGTSLVAVGAAHLAGSDSVLKMLEANGRKIEKVQ